MDSKTPRMFLCPSPGLANSINVRKRLGSSQGKTVDHREFLEQKIWQWINFKKKSLPINGKYISENSLKKLIIGSFQNNSVENESKETNPF